MRCGATREPTHVPVSFPRIPARESLSLACPRESNQREGHPRGRGHAGIHARVTTRGRCGGSLTARPCTDSERARIVRAPLTGFFLRALAAAEREPGRSRARPSWPQKPKRKAKQRKPRTPRPSFQRKLESICTCLGFAFDVGPCGAAKGGRIRPARQRGAARGIALIPLQGRMPCQRNPGRP